MDLQLFAEERTEEATPRKEEEVRKEGRAARSQDLAAGVGLVAATMALQMGGPRLYESLAGSMVETFSHLSTADLTVAAVQARFTDWVVLSLQALLPICGAILAVGIALGLFQGRLTFSWKPLAPDFSRINPASGFSRMFSLRTLVEQGKGLLKLTIVGFVGYQEVTDLLPQIPNLLGQSVAAGIVALTSRAVTGLQTIGFALLALGVLDYGYQYWEFRKSIRMTKQEVKQEHKQQEGNPESKQRQRQTAREMARRRRALKAVPTADVIITNPTHYAVAIRYSAGKDAAPRVIAKGTDLLAQRIKVIARQHGVPAVENRSLARALYAGVDVDQGVPPELYLAVAEVLAFVYSLRRQQRRPHIS